MFLQNQSLLLPAYQAFLDKISVLDLPISASELHGRMCAYLCAGAASEGEAYLRALTLKKADESVNTAAFALFEIYSISQHQLFNFDFAFQLLLPGEHEPLIERAQAFSEWCGGFTQGLRISGIGDEQFHDEESRESFQHLQEFARLDYDRLQVGEEDERALLEVSEYTRLAVLRLYGDLFEGRGEASPAKMSH